MWRNHWLKSKAEGRLRGTMRSETPSNSIPRKADPIAFDSTALALEPLLAW